MTLQLRFLGALTAAAGLLAGCATTPLPSLSDLPERELAGHLTIESSGNWFRACSALANEEPAWVTFTDRAVRQRSSAAYAGLLRSNGTVFVRWRAAVGDRAMGAAPGPGPGRHYVLVRDIIEVRPATENDCAPAT